MHWPSKKVAKPLKRNWRNFSDLQVQFLGGALKEGRTVKLYPKYEKDVYLEINVNSAKFAWIHILIMNDAYAGINWGGRTWNSTVLLLHLSDATCLQMAERCSKLTEERKVKQCLNVSTVLERKENLTGMIWADCSQSPYKFTKIFTVPALKE